MDSFEAAEKTLDKAGKICQLNHMDAPYRPRTESVRGVRALTDSTTSSAKALADEYLREAMPLFGLDASLLLQDQPQGRQGGTQQLMSAEQIVFEAEKSTRGNATVVYHQTIDGVPVWESGLVVQVEEAPMQVIGSQSTVKRDLQVSSTNLSTANFVATKLNETVVKGLLNIGPRESVKLLHVEPFVYPYSAEKRLQIPSRGPTGDQPVSPPFMLPPVASVIEDGAAYLVSAVEFLYEAPAHAPAGWLALIEQNSGSVLMLRSQEGCCMRMVAEAMPASPPDQSGNGQAVGQVPGPAVGLVSQRPSVVFFDIGDTLGKAVLGQNGQLARIDVFPEALEVVKELFEKQVRVGLISDPGSISTDLIRSMLQDTGILAFIDSALVVWGAKNSRAIFDSAAVNAGVAATECLFVGENSSERSFAEEAGFSSIATPANVFSLVDPNAALAWVYLTDPRTKVGASAPSPSASGAALDRFRDLVSLVGLDSFAPGSNQQLQGRYVKLQNLEAPNIAPPSSPVPGDFRYSVNTNDFGAVSAYHNCDRLFRLLEDFGITVAGPTGYFNGTTFPVRVDHRVQYENANRILTANIVNASAPGFRFPPRSDGFRLALAAENTSVSIAADWRVLLHEFGHALLWDNVGSPNFRFAHSAGDALAAILNDTGNRATRGTTFPWVQIGRSHMRPVSSWAWYGTRYSPFRGADRAGYVAEEILSSTLFRIYRAAGGDSVDTKDQLFAANYVAFLIIKSIGMMTSANNPEGPEGYADLMMQADTGSFLYRNETTTIGGLRKVIRWAFEMQGAYRQPADFGTQPTDQVGNPPQVDVFINDGRDGHYVYSGMVNARDVWNRRQADSGAVHQDPVAGQDNFAYVRISNRGLSTANGVEVSAFQSTSSSEQDWPIDWQPLTDSVLNSGAPIVAGGDAIVGPFRWVANSMEPTLLMSVSALGDQSNLSRFTGVRIPIGRLVPLDNNLAVRTMQATVVT